MEKAGILFLLLFTAFFTGCGYSEFNGSRTGNESQFIMEYKVLNKTDSQLMQLEEGDKVDFEIVSEAGRLDIVVWKEEEDPIYTGTDIPTGPFQITITESGTYNFSVTGRRARGSVSIMKAEKG